MLILFLLLVIYATPAGAEEEIETTIIRIGEDEELVIVELKHRTEWCLDITGTYMLCAPSNPIFRPDSRP